MPGIPEAMRALSLQITPRATLSRAAAGIRKGALIVNLPGSPKAVGECLEYILPPLSHGLSILKGTTATAPAEPPSPRRVNFESPHLRRTLWAGTNGLVWKRVRLPSL